MESLDEQRSELIERIKMAFPKNPPQGKGKRGFEITQHSDFEGNRLRKTLEGKLWSELGDCPSLTSMFTDFDYVFAMTTPAFRYYLPAFLVQVLNHPDAVADGYSRFFERFWSVREKFTSEQIEIVIAFLRLDAALEDADEWSNHRIEELETYQLQMMLYLDERKGG